MLVDPAGLPTDHLLDADVCIVGAGPAGITIARELLGTGAKVCLLESGGRDPGRGPAHLNRGESVGYSTYLLHRARVRAFAGTSRHWPLDEGWRARPLDPIDFESRPWIPHSGWPFDRSHLDPFYERAQSICRLGPCDYEAKRWEHAGRHAFALPPDLVESSVFQLGSSDFDGYYEELVRAPSVSLALHATVTGLAAGEDPGTIERVEVRHPDGSRWLVAPRIVVLAAGGIENPRLLLLNGLGNAHDLAGRFFAERLSTRTGHIVPGRADLARDVDFYADHHVVEGTRLQGTLRVAEHVQRDRGLRNCAFFVLARPRAMTAASVRSLATLTKAPGRKPWPEQPAAHARNVLRGLGAIGAVGLARLGRTHERVLVLRAQAEQAPNPASRVTLGERRDAFGLPVARVDWRPVPDDRRSIRASQLVLDEALRAAGLGHVEEPLGDEHPPALLEGNRHHLGTTRMHDDPRHGVVDASCRVHGTTNLYVAGSSTFPTYGCSNPTLTIVALALRLAGRLRSELGVPS